MDGDIYHPTRAQLSGLLTGLRSSPELRGFVGSARVAVAAGLPAWAYKAGSTSRLYLRRSGPSEPGTILGELHESGREPKVVVTDKGLAGRRQTEPGELRNMTIRISREMRREMERYGSPAEVIRLAVEQFIARSKGEPMPERELRQVGVRGPPRGAKRGPRRSKEGT